MPMLDACGDVHRIAFADAPCGLAPLLIIAFASCDDENLAAAFCRMMDMPVVAAGRFKRHTEGWDLLQ